MEDLFKANLSSMQLYWLETSLKARADGLDRRIFSFGDLDEYAQKSLVPILWCLEGIIGSKSGDKIRNEHNLEHLGKAQLIIRRLKGLGKALSLKNPSAEQFIPTSLLGSLGVNGPEMIDSLKTGNLDKLTEVVYKMASHAHSHVKLISSENNADSDDLFLKLSKYTANRYLNELERAKFFILEEKVRRIGSERDGLLPLKLYFKSF